MTRTTTRRPFPPLVMRPSWPPGFSRGGAGDYRPRARAGAGIIGAKEPLASRVGRYEELMEAFAACRETAEVRRLTLGEAFSSLEGVGLRLRLRPPGAPVPPAGRPRPDLDGPRPLARRSSAGRWRAGPPGALARRPTGRRLGSRPRRPGESAASAVATKVLGFCRRFTRRRPGRTWVSGARGSAGRGGDSMILAGGGRPHLPAARRDPRSRTCPPGPRLVVFVALGELEEDGLMLVAALATLDG